MPVHTRPLNVSHRRAHAVNVPVFNETIVVSRLLTTFTDSFDLAKHPFSHLQRRDIFEVRWLNQFSRLHVFQILQDPISQLFASERRDGAIHNLEMFVRDDVVAVGLAFERSLVRRERLWELA